MATNPYTEQSDELFKSPTVEPVTQEFDESKGVAARTNDIIKQDSPLMQTAATRAAQQANARGLRNSSMAVQSGQQAVIESATPIANADANLYQQQSLTNQGVRNQTNQFNATNSQQNNQFGRSLMEQARQFDFGQSQQEQQFLKDLALRQNQLTTQAKTAADQMENQRTIAQMDAASKEKLIGIEAQYKTSIAGNENISQAWGSMMDGISRIQNNPDLDAATKATQIQNTINGFQSFTNFWNKVGGGTLDVSDLLNFGISSVGTAGPSRDVPSPTLDQSNGA
jgi:hypothetical protein